MRGRNRKSTNPLTRSYESNGPDVKIRGTALHIAEKYLQLWRDAQVSDDRVTAENYLQHAEHYFRMIAAAQQYNQSNQQPRDTDQKTESLSEESRPRPSNGADEVMPADAPQPYLEVPARRRAPVNGESAKDNGTGGSPGNGDDTEVDMPVVAKTDDDDEAPARRRVRGSRGRGVRRGAQSAETQAAKSGEPDDDEGASEQADEPSETSTPSQQDS